MPEFKKLHEAYDQCLADGFIRIEQTVNIKQLKDAMQIAETCIETAELISKHISSADRKWMNVYLHYYEALRIYTEILVKLDKKKINNHQCLFAYLCQTFLHLDLSWEFFEKIRTKRNGVHYYGVMVGFKDWKEVELQYKLYISTLKKEIEKLISQA